MSKSPKIGTFIPFKLLNNPVSSLRNFNFLLLHTEQFDKSIVVPFLVLTNLRFLLSVIFQRSSKITLFYI